LIVNETQKSTVVDKVLNILHVILKFTVTRKASRKQDFMDI